MEYSTQAFIDYIIPFIDNRKAYVHTLKEQALDIPEQICITRDNISGGRRRRHFHSGVLRTSRWLPMESATMLFAIVQLARIP